MWISQPSSKQTFPLLSLTASQLTCIIYTFSYSLLVYVTTSLLEFQPEDTFLKPNTVKNGAANISVARATSKGSKMEASLDEEGDSRGVAFSAIYHL